MAKALRIIILTITTILVYVPVGIADCPSCGTVCLLRDPFNHNHCIKQGTDPVCQAKHNTCTSGEKVFDTIRNTLLNICSTPLRTYELGLEAQASGRWKSLPSQLIANIQAQYPDVPLASVQYAQNITTSNGDAQTFGDRIYFPRTIDLSNCTDLHWMLHELEHTGQYARAGESSKLCEYMAKAAGSGFQHDKMDIEQAADRKADYLVDSACRAMNFPPVSTPQLAQGLALNQLFVQNDTDQPVYYSLETTTHERTSFTIPPHTNTVHTGGDADRWFNIIVITNGVQIEYGLDGGTRQHLAWNSKGLIDVFKEQ